MSTAGRDHQAVDAAGRIVHAGLPAGDNHGIEGAVRTFDAARDQALDELAAGADQTLVIAELASWIVEEWRSDINPAATINAMVHAAPPGGRNARLPHHEERRTMTTNAALTYHGDWCQRCESKAGFVDHIATWPLPDGGMVEVSASDDLAGLGLGYAAGRDPEASLFVGTLLQTPPHDR